MTKTHADRAAVGVAEHGNSAVLVTVGPDGEFLDRRRIDLTHDLPTHPYHHEGSWAVGSLRQQRMGTADVALRRRGTGRTRARGRRAPRARKPGDACRGGARADRAHRNPRVPRASDNDRSADRRHPRGNVADSVMYREALATAGEARGWSVHWYDRERVFHHAAVALGGEDLDIFLHAMARAIGPPWQAKHKLAAAAALAARARK